MASRRLRAVNSLVETPKPGRIVNIADGGRRAAIREVSAQGGRERDRQMRTVTKKELVDRIAGQANTKPVLVRQIIQSLLDEIVQELAKGNRLEFRDFGVFDVRQRAAHANL